MSKYRLVLKDSTLVKIAYHGTSKENALEILYSGFKGESIYLSESEKDSEGYGKVILGIDISSLNLYVLSQQDLDNSDFSERKGYDGILYKRSEDTPYNVQVFNVEKLNDCPIKSCKIEGVRI